ncbi:hypothetical protein [Sorangium sp. So ce362]|uniref:hypothetical protein n=1 Tax=Sorangium sp. So ce362 TaxID=3133303 RepID=UPI003F5E039D
MPEPESPANSAFSTKTKPARAKQESPAEDCDPSKDRHDLRQLVARCGVIDATDRAACDELIDDAGRAELGGRTRDS